jgi:chlorobactene glucosyltransferase
MTVALVAVLVVLAIPSIVAFLNALAAPVLGEPKIEEPAIEEPAIEEPAIEEPKVSVLVPARDEEGNVGACLDAVLGQTYRNFEALALDDDSSDGTRREIDERARRDARVRRLDGAPLPEGWLGKNWACRQLAAAAEGDLFLFVDADVRLAPNALGAAVARMRADRSRLLTVFPTQRLDSFGERLVTPLMNWVLLSLVYLPTIWRTRRLSLSAANGQFLLFDRAAYERIGGHATARLDPVEDMRLAIETKRARYRITTLLGGEAVSCRMYDGFASSWRGFLKNFYPGFRLPAWLFLLFFGGFSAAFFAPFPLAFFDPRFLLPAAIATAQRGLVALVSRQPVALHALLTPAHALLLIILGGSSIWTSTHGGVLWKGRTISSTANSRAD